MKILKFFTVIFSAVSLTAEVYSLTIDNQLVIIANDCYTRIAIGSILPPKEIAASVIAATVTECEDECSRKRSTCEIFSFGISSKGNATCLLGNRVPNAEELLPNSDYDIYIRQQSSPHCMPDRLYKLGSGSRNPINYNTDHEREIEGEKNVRNNETDGRPKPGKRPIPEEGIPRPGGLGIVEIPNGEKIPANGNRENNPNYYENNANYPVHQIVELTPNFPPAYSQPGIIFDENNPNVPGFNYGNKNVYENIHSVYGPSHQGNENVEGNQNFNTGYRRPLIAPDFYYPSGEHEAGDENGKDYYLHGVIGSGNQYGINFYETPDTICKLKQDFGYFFLLLK